MAATLKSLFIHHEDHGRHLERRCPSLHCSCSCCTDPLQEPTPNPGAPGNREQEGACMHGQGLFPMGPVLPGGAWPRDAGSRWLPIRASFPGHCLTNVSSSDVMIPPTPEPSRNTGTEVSLSHCLLLLEGLLKLGVAAGSGGEAEERLSPAGLCEPRADELRPARDVGMWPRRAADRGTWGKAWSPRKPWLQ